MNLDALTYAGNPDNLAGRRRRPALPLRRTATSPTATPSAAAGRGLRRDRQLRRREPRRPLDQRRAPFLADQRARHPVPARRRARAAGVAATSRSRPTRSTATLGRRPLVHRGRPRWRPTARTPPSKAGGDLLVLRVLHTLRPRRRHHPLLEQLRPVPVPREADPAVRHQRARRPAAAGLRRRPAGARLDPRRATTAAASTLRAAERRAPARSTTSAARASGPTSTSRAGARAARQAETLIRTSPTAPATTAATRSTAAKLRAPRLERPASLRRRPGATRWTGTATTAPGGSRSSPARRTPPTTQRTTTGARRARGRGAPARGRRAARCSGR